MRRPLEEQPPINPELRDALVATACPTWYERLSLQLYMAARHAFKIPVNVTHFNTKSPYLIFNSLDEVMTLLDLEKVAPRLTRGQILRYPVEAPAIDQSRHFAQWAVVWEPVTNDLCAAQTLKVEVGAGMCLLSLSFTPLAGAAERGGKKMQLDEITLQRGHDAYDIPVGQDGGAYDSDQIARVRQLLMGARETIQMIHDDYPLAETALADATRPVFEHMSAREQEYLRQEAALEADQQRQNGRNPGLSAPQEP